MKAAYSVEIKGKSWAQAKLMPQDPFQTSPDRSRLQLMTWSEIEGRRTPVVNVIDAVEVTSLRRYALKEDSMMLAYPADNPFLAWHQLDFKSWLLQQNLLKVEQLEAPAAEPSLTVSRPKAAAPKRNFNIYQPPKEDQDLWGQIDKPAEPIELPLAAEEAIVDLLNWAFYRMTLTNLRIHPDEMKRLKKLAKELRLALQSKEAVLAKLDQVLGKHSFETPISRRAVRALIHQAKLGGELQRLEDLCPIDQQPFEQGGCPVCGFRLSWPEGEGHSAPVSAEPSTALYPGQLLVPHLRLNSLLTLNIWRQPLQSLDGTAAGIQQLAHASVLPNLNYLVADSKGNKVLEISPSGEQIWKAKLALKQPSMVTWWQPDGGDTRFIIVDQGNARILELDRAGKHWRRYPGLKTDEADKLKRPVDVMLTPTQTWLISDPGLGCVLEITPAGMVLNRYGAELGLKSPILARRMPDGMTEIIDAGGFWLEIGTDAQLTRRFEFWPPKDPKWRSAAAPDWACQLHNGEYLLMGPDYLLMIGPRHESLRWISALPDPKREDSLLKVAFRSRTLDESRKAQSEAHAKELHGMGALEGEKAEQIEYLAKFVKATRAGAGDWLLQPETMGNALYFVLEGAIEVIAPEDELPVIYTAETGDIVGVQAVFAQDAQSYKPGLRAKAESKLLILERGEFKKAVVGFARLYNILRQLEQDCQRRFKLFAERKSEAVQDHLRGRINETRVREFGLFMGAEDAFFEALSDKVQPLAYMPEQDVFGRLESGGSLFLILEGTVGVLRKGESEPLIVLAEGEVFGEMALYLEQPRSATVRTLDYCKFFEIEYRHVRALGKTFPWFGERLSEMARQRQQGNQIALDAYEADAGLKRTDLPAVEVVPAGLRLGQKVFYLPSLHHDALVGLNSLGELLWFWGRETDKQVFQPTRVHDLGDSILAIDTGNDRVLELDKASRSILRKWSTGLSRPRAACFTPEGLLLVADEGHQRLVAMDESGREVWTHGLPEEIMLPTWVEFTEEGHILFADAGMHRVYELKRDGTLLWKHGKWRNPGSALDQLDSPSCVRRLTDGSTLIADAGNSRLVWVRPEADPLIISLDAHNLVPEACELLENGEILVSSAKQDRLIRLNRRGELTWKASLSFPAQTVAAASTEATAEGERWILDIERLDELASPEPLQAAERPEPEPQLSEAPTAGAWQDLGAALGEVFEAAETLPDTYPEQIIAPLIESAFEQELEAALDESKPAEPEWAELAFLENVVDTGHTLHMPPTTDVAPQNHWDGLGFLDQSPETVPAASAELSAPALEVAEDLDAAMAMMFGDEPDLISDLDPSPAFTASEPASESADPDAEKAATETELSSPESDGPEPLLAEAEIRPKDFEQTDPEHEDQFEDQLKDQSESESDDDPKTAPNADPKVDLRHPVPVAEASPWDLGI